MTKKYAPRLINLNGRRMAEFMLAGSRRRIPLGTDCDNEAQSLVQHLADAAPSYETCESSSLHGNVRRTLKKRLDWSQTRAATRGLEHDITLEHLLDLYDGKRGRCAVTGIHFDISDRSKTEDGWKRPFSPSVDRIDARQGYTAGNVRLVCSAVNNAMGSWGEGVFIHLAYALVAHRNGTSRA